MTDELGTAEWQLRLQAHAEAARDMRAYFDALLEAGFEEELASRLLTAWVARVPGMDAPTLAALIDRMKADPE